MIAKLERALNTTKNKDKTHKNPATMEATLTNEATTSEPPP